MVYGWFQTENHIQKWMICNLSGLLADTFSEGVSPKSFLDRRCGKKWGQGPVFWSKLGWLQFFWFLLFLPKKLRQLWAQGSKKYSHHRHHPSFLGKQVVNLESAKKVLSLAANSWQDFRKVNLAMAGKSRGKPQGLRSQDDIQGLEISWKMLINHWPNHVLPTISG